LFFWKKIQTLLRERYWSMKATLEFDMLEEREELENAIHGGEWKSVVWELDQKLRGYLKYEHTFKNVDEALEKLREELHDEVNERGLQLS
jgi:hypothetical protein